MSKKSFFIFDNIYWKFDFSSAHPMQPIRLKLTYDLIKSYKLIPDGEEKKPKRATEKELELIHNREYIEAVKKAGQGGLSLTRALRYGLGTSDNPVFPKIHEVSSYIVGGSLIAADLIAQGKAEHAFNISGGLHHALKSRASGFCIYNDAAISIAHLVKNYQMKVVYIDIDAHHGDGVQWAFYNSPQVLTISLHESGKYLFPGTGFVEEIGEGEGRGYSVNVPFEPETDDQSFLYAFNQIVPPLIETFKPNILVTQCGCDAHFQDPLSHLNLSIRAYQKVFKEMHQLAHEKTNGKWLALGGGGYDIFSVVPRAWTILFAEMSSVTLPPEIPSSWFKLCQSASHRLPKNLYIEEFPVKMKEENKKLERTKALVEKVKELIFPYHFKK